VFLVDTNIISAVAPTKRGRSENLAAWLDRAGPHLFLSAITAAEITSVIVKAEREGATTKAAALRDWWQAIEHLYADQFLLFDVTVAHVAGRILDRARAVDVGFEDIAIAATAETHGLTVLTANERHFQPLGVAFINPLKALPSLPLHKS
jgi:predicted nucleic acid-binding protein